MLLLSGSYVVAADAEPTSNDAFNEVITPLFLEHCVACHGIDEEVSGDVDLVTLKQETLVRSPELLRKLIDVLVDHEMPPEDEPQPSDAQRLKVVVTLRDLLHQSVKKDTSYGQAPIRRMNRFQYNNAVTDLFQLNCIVFTLPERMMREHKGYFKPETGRMADVVHVGNRPLGKSQMIEPRLAGVAAFPQDLRAEHGFDNRGDHLSMSPLLMNSFLALGQSITESPDFGPRTVGIWQEFFVPPSKETELHDEISRRLRPFLTRAFRRPVDEKTLDRYSSYVLRQIEGGVEFTVAMKSVAAAVIASPRFLYLYDTVSNDSPETSINDYELASRLAFFLWGSLPDETLLELARRGELSRPDVLQSQFHRMVTDHKLKRFCDSFPAQWLQLDRLISSVPNPEMFPEFYFSKYRDSMHMMMEPLLVFETVVIEDQPLTQLIDSDFTYRSGHLEDAYGVLKSNEPKGRGGEVEELTFHRVPVSDRRAGGVITNAAVMTMTSGTERTKPITRGAWMATVIFNDPPEPPPGDVPPLAEKPPADEEQLTLRERLVLHRERADCRGCHEKIDPLGFAFENYNAVGAWRDAYENGRDVDTSGTLFHEHEFHNVVEFKDAVLAEKDRLTRALAGHLLSFALARELGAKDELALDEIVKATAADDYKMQTLLRQVVLSEPFRSKDVPGQPVATTKQ
ncbi:MAG: DUF1592 domain-containing protein [Planctomycetaceae bacterium]|nr:DUF1592 domain-containing protein [Planctomycetaceae bacterium]